ncbi:MAG TPA: tRNA dihydrouridine(20/20a) synthase DusA [Gammaproteobacteria bacterium]|nr:tRNA dihydrouridine(20/20a) synthase DusA [Gammaproteobacteria bacterium]
MIIDRSISVAPMMACTDRHFRYLVRLISRHAVLYTEMMTTSALLHGGASSLLAYDAAEHTLALQLGGSRPLDMARCARLAEATGYDEVNINVGCPSGRVQEARFGACLMAEPELVADCVAAMCAAVAVPVTVKCRIGVDEHDSYQALARFISTVASAGCITFIIHARKAWLKDLNPKENRNIPPLRHDVVHRLKRDFPQLTIILNGGISTLEQARAHLSYVDGVMLGREAYHNPYILVNVDRCFYADIHPIPSREQVLACYVPYLATQLAAGTRLAHIVPHLMGLFQGLAGARVWRRSLSEQARRRDAGVEVVMRAARRLKSIAHNAYASY